MRYARILLALSLLMIVGGCTTSVGFGDDPGFGVKTVVAKDGKIVSLETTDGDGAGQ